MKKITVISLLFAFLCSSTELHEFLKVPVLVHHFLEHLQENSNESLAGFLKDHYADKITHSDDRHHDHEKLPFKVKDCATTHLFIAFVSVYSFSAKKIVYSTEKITAVYQETPLSSSVLNSIWQPPKFC